jgi:hypothetical protein
MLTSSRFSAYAHAQARPVNPRGQSNLAHSSVGWNNTDNDRLSADEDEEQGHIAPASAAAGAGAATMSEKPAWAQEGGYASKKSRKGLWIAAGLGALVIIGLAVGLGVG